MAKIFLVLSFIVCYTSSGNTSSGNLCPPSTNVLSPCSFIQSQSVNCSICDITVNNSQCNSLDTSEYSKWLASEAPRVETWDGQTVIRLTDIDLKPADPAQYHLALKWSFVKNDKFNLTRAFLIHLSCKVRCVEHKKDNKCCLLDFQSFLDGEEPSFTTPYMTVNLGVHYDVTITSLPSNEQTKYTVFVPSTPPQEIMTLSEWSPVIAASADPYHQVVTVVFEPAPAALNVSGYTLKLSDDNSFTSRNITQQEGVIIQEYSRSPLVNYTVNLTVFGHGNECEAGCEAMWEPDLLKVWLPDKSPSVPWGESTETTSEATDTTPGVEVTSETAQRPRVKVTTTRPAHVTTVVPTTEEPSNNTNVYIIIGVLLGVVMLIALVIIIFILYRRRHRYTDNGMGMQILGKDYNADTDSKIPSALVLYSYDCAAHEQVVIEFCNFLKNEWRIEVYLDLWEQKDIAERGCTQWLQENLIRSQFVIIVSSTGARIKCARNRQSRMKYDRAVPDMFSDAVDLVLQRSHANRQENAVSALNNQPTFTCLVVLFPYSCGNDIPPKLDTCKKFLLMKELYELYCKLSCAQQDQLPSKFPAISPSKYKTTRLGRQLSQVLQKAVDYFDSNRDWVAERLEPVSPPLSLDHRKLPQPPKDPSQLRKDETQPDPHAQSVSRENSPSHHVNSKPQQQESAGHSRMSSTISSTTEEDALLLEERKKKRQKEEELKMEKVPSLYQPLTEFHKDENSTDGTVHPMGNNHNNTTNGNGGSSSTGGSNSSTMVPPPAPPSLVSLDMEDGTTKPYQNGEGSNHGPLGPYHGPPPAVVGKNWESSSSTHSHSRSNSEYSSLNRSHNRNHQQQSLPPAPPGHPLTNGYEDPPLLLNGNFEEEEEDDELQRDIAFILNEHTGSQMPSVGDSVSLLPKERHPINININNNHQPLEFQAANVDSDLAFFNPVYCKMKGEAGPPGKAGLYGVSDRNENFIIDLGNPQETLNYLTQSGGSSNVERQFSTTSSERGTQL